MEPRITALVEYTEIRSLLKQLAQFCITHKLHRDGTTGAKVHCFNKNELVVINAAYQERHQDINVLQISGGYMFLDAQSATSGMIRLFTNDTNPKWSFWKDATTGAIMTDVA
jgi:hypothetical protein